MKYFGILIALTLLSCATTKEVVDCKQKVTDITVSERSVKYEKEGRGGCE